MHEFCSLSLDLKTVEPSENAGEKLQVLEGIDKKLRQGAEKFYCPPVHQMRTSVISDQNIHVESCNIL